MISLSPHTIHQQILLALQLYTIQNLITFHVSHWLPLPFTFSNWLFRDNNLLLATLPVLLHCFYNVLAKKPK
jgi:hypothetical protein